MGKKLICTILGSECPQLLVDTFSFAPFPNGYFGEAFVYIASLPMQTKEIFWNHLTENGFNQFQSCHLETDIRFRTNHQQPPGFKHHFICILECSLSHSLIVRTEVVHWGKIPKGKKTKKHFNG